MQGDTIVIEEHHKKAAHATVTMLLEDIKTSGGKYTMTVAGQSGAGKSEIAVAIAEELAVHDISTVILQQDDYFVYPPKTNDKARRQDITWVGPGEVNLELMDRHLRMFRAGKESTVKPLVIYEQDAIKSEDAIFADKQVAIAEGTYTTLLDAADAHVYINRNFEETRAHREKRKRDAAELDPFIDDVLEIEHHIISSHKPRAQIIINSDYSAERS
jgi:uridine kinase